MKPTENLVFDAEHFTMSNVTNLFLLQLIFDLWWLCKNIFLQHNRALHACFYLLHLYFIKMFKNKDFVKTKAKIQNIFSNYMLYICFFSYFLFLLVTFLSYKNVTSKNKKKIFISLLLIKYTFFSN